MSDERYPIKEKIEFIERLICDAGDKLWQAYINLVEDRSVIKNYTNIPRNLKFIREECNRIEELIDAEKENKDE